MMSAPLTDRTKPPILSISACKLGSTNGKQLFCCKTQNVKHTRREYSSKSFKPNGNGQKISICVVLYIYLANISVLQAQNEQPSFPEVAWSATIFLRGHFLVYHRFQIHFFGVEKNCLGSQKKLNYKAVFATVLLLILLFPISIEFHQYSQDSKHCGHVYNCILLKQQIFLNCFFLFKKFQFLGH